MILKKIKVPHFFIISILFSLLVLLIERSININYDYHPDSQTYLNNSSEDLIISFYQNPIQFLGSFYYVWVSFFFANNFSIIFKVIEISSFSYSPKFIISIGRVL